MTLITVGTFFFCQLYADTKSKLCVACTDKILEYVTHQQEQSYTAIPHKIPQALTNVGYTIKERNVYSSLHLFLHYDLQHVCLKTFYKDNKIKSK